MSGIDRPEGKGLTEVSESKLQSSLSQRYRQLFRESPRPLFDRILPVLLFGGLLLLPGSIPAGDAYDELPPPPDVQLTINGSTEIPKVIYIGQTITLGIDVSSDEDYEVERVDYHPSQQFVAEEGKGYNCYAVVYFRLKSSDPERHIKAYWQGPPPEEGKLVSVKTPPKAVPAPLPPPPKVPRFTSFNISPSRLKAGQPARCSARAESGEGEDISDRIQWECLGATATGSRFELTIMESDSQVPKLENCNIQGPSSIRVYVQEFGGLLLPPFGGAGYVSTDAQSQIYRGVVQVSNGESSKTHTVSANVTDSSNKTAEKSGSIEVLSGKISYNWRIKGNEYFGYSPELDELEVFPTHPDAATSGSFQIFLSVSTSKQRISCDKNVSVSDGRDPNM